MAYEHMFSWSPVFFLEDSDAVMQLFRSGGLELLTEDFTGREVNILGG